jgi:hypothetical protein
LFSGRCAFGIDTDMQNDINNPYLQKLDEIVKKQSDEFLVFRLANLFPFLARPLNFIVFGLTGVRSFLIKLLPFLSNYLKEIPVVWLLNRVGEIYKLRTKSMSNLTKRVDLLQLMIDSSTEEKVIVSQII